MEDLLLLKIRNRAFHFVFFFLILFFSEQKLFSQGGGYAITKQISGIGYSSKIYDATNGLPTSDSCDTYEAEDS